MNRALSLAKFEFKAHMNWKADVISLAVIAVVLLLRFWTVEVIHSSPPITLGIHTETQSLSSALQDSEYASIDRLIQEPNLSKLQELLEDGEIDAYAVICADCQELRLTIYSLDELETRNYIESITSDLSDLIIPQLYSLNNDDYSNIKNGFLIDYQNSANRDGTNGRIITTVFMFLACISVLTAFSLLLQGITFEKEEKITEMYISSMHVSEWVDGKVLSALGIAVKGLLIYMILSIIALDFFGFTTFNREEVQYLILNKSLPLLISFSIGFVFWCYFYALVSVILTKASTSIKNAAVLLPMAAFGIIISVSDYVSNTMYNVLCILPITYIFAVPSKVISSDFEWSSFFLFSAVALLATLWLRKTACRRLKFI